MYLSLFNGKRTFLKRPICDQGQFILVFIDDVFQEGRGRYERNGLTWEKYSWARIKRSPCII